MGEWENMDVSDQQCSVSQCPYIYLSNTVLQKLQLTTELHQSKAVLHQLAAGLRFRLMPERMSKNNTVVTTMALPPQ